MSGPLRSGFPSIACRMADGTALQRRLLYSLATGEVLGPRMTRLAYPFRAFYSALNAADYFRSAALFDGTPADPRLSDAIESIRSARKPNGIWLQERRHPGRVWFEVDVDAAEPSHWLTFYATRVLSWWDETAAIPSAGSSRAERN